MMKKITRRLVLCMVVVMMLIPAQTFAIDRIDLDESVSLTIEFTHEGQPLPGAQLQIYKVADISERGEFTFLEPFSGYPLQFNELDGNDWAAIANTLNAYVQLDDVQPTAAGVTDSTGSISFPRARSEMEPGLYLITGDTLTYNDMCFTPVPTLVTLPNREENSHQWDYSVTVAMKYTFRTAPVDYTVMKVWKDDGSEAARPASVKINLLKDGEIADTVELSRDNNWTYTWTELERGYTWTVTEEVPDGYTVSITEGQQTAGAAVSGSVSSANTVFTVTNTYTPPEDSKLPQTGSLWWPVPVLMIAGLGCLIVGFMRMKGSRNER